MLDHHKIVYVKFPSADFEKTKAFFATAFGWEFEDFGADYTAFSGAGLNGGFFAADRAIRKAKGTWLIVF